MSSYVQIDIRLRFVKIHNDQWGANLLTYLSIVVVGFD